jgi:hypothetical protein
MGTFVGLDVSLRATSTSTCVLDETDARAFEGKAATVGLGGSRTRAFYLNHRVNKPL